MLSIGLYLDEKLVPLPYSRLANVVVSKDKHGSKQLKFELELSLADAGRIIVEQRIYDVRVYWFAELVWQGRADEIVSTLTGVKVSASGYWHAMYDTLHTSLWSTTDLSKWEVLTDAEVSGIAKDTYDYDNKNRIYITIRKNVVIRNNNDFPIYAFRIPHENSLGAQIRGISFDAKIVLPTNFQFILGHRTWDWASPATDFLYASAGSTVTIPVNITYTGVDAVYFLIYNNIGGDFTNTFEAGGYYISVSNIRIVTSITNRIDTTFTANRAAGSNVTATVGSTARMYVGQLLQIKQGSISGETVTVLSIGSSTQFNATFINSYVIGDTVNAHVLYADQVVKDLISDVDNENDNQISTSYGLVNSPALDILDFVAEDMRPGDVISTLGAKGDNQTTPQFYIGGAWDKTIFFNAVGTDAQTYYVDANDLEIVFTLDDLYNEIYATYKQAGGLTLRSAFAVDVRSQVTYQLTRQDFTNADTTSSVTALVERDAYLADRKDTSNRGRVSFDRVFLANGGSVPLALVRPGDIFVLRNLPASIAVLGSVDKIRSFRLGETIYDVAANKLTVTPDIFIRPEKQSRLINEADYVVPYSPTTVIGGHTVRWLR